MTTINPIKTFLISERFLI